MRKERGKKLRKEKRGEQTIGKRYPNRLGSTWNATSGEEGIRNWKKKEGLERRMRGETGRGSKKTLVSRRSEPNRFKAGSIPIKEKQQLRSMKEEKNELTTKGVGRGELEFFRGRIQEFSYSRLGG